jgi:vacuolar-type H+-ATPase subunit C/Vma6
MNPLDTCSSFMTAYCKGAESRTVDAEHLGRMLKAPGVKELVASVHDTDLGRYLEEHPPGGFDEADESLWRYLAGCFGALERLTRFPAEMREILAAWLLKYDLANVMAALRGLGTGRTARMIPLGGLSAKGALEALAAAPDADTIAAIVAECRLAVFAAPLAAWQAATDGAGRLAAEGGLSKACLRELATVARKFGRGGPLDRAAGLLIDCANLQLAFRAAIGNLGPTAANAAVEGGVSISPDLARELAAMKVAEIPARIANTPHAAAAAEITAQWSRSSSAAAVEDVLCRHRLALLREALAMRLLSPVLIAWYAALKEAETRNVRLLLKAKFDELPEERVRESLAPPW